MSVVQTLDGAWADAFGTGIGTITLSGHTGWRGSFSESGEELFKTLRTTVFQEWHERRAAAIAAGQSPTTIELIFVDTLNGITSLVAPRSFTLKRSKSAPLLSKYQIQLIELGDAANPADGFDSILGGLNNPLRWLASVLGLENVIKLLSDAIKFVTGIFGVIADYVRAFVKLVVQVLGVVADVARGAQGIFDRTVGSLLHSALALTQAGRNAFRMLASSGTLASNVRQQVMRIASLFNDASCSLSNGFNVGRYFTSFDDLFGASNCSSTAGGRGWSTFTEQAKNPFSAMYPPVASRVAVSPQARQAIETLQRDPIAAPRPATDVGRMLDTIAGGVRVA